MINNTSIVHKVHCALVNLKRDGVDYTLNLAVSHTETDYMQFRQAIDENSHDITDFHAWFEPLVPTDRAIPPSLQKGKGVYFKQGRL